MKVALRLAALVLVLAAGSAGGARHAGSEIRGAVWAAQCGVEPGVCRLVRVPGATVRACLVTGGGCKGVAYGRTGRDGRYRLLVARPGRYRLTATKRVSLGAYRPRPRDVLAGRGQVIRVELGKPSA